MKNQKLQRSISVIFVGMNKMKSRSLKYITFISYWTLVFQLLPHHPAGTSVDSVCFWAYQSILTRFYNGGLWENIFWSIHKWSIDLTQKLYWTIIFYIRDSQVMLELFSWLRNASDIHRFPTLHMVNIHFLLENLWISKSSLSIFEKLQCSLAVPNIKYNCTILFLYECIDHLCML